MVLFWTVLVLAIAAAVRYLDRKRRESFPPPPPPPTAEQVLAERLKTVIPPSVPNPAWRTPDELIPALPAIP